MVFVIFWYVLNWLLTAAFLSRIFQLVSADESQHPRLHEIVDRLCRKAGMRKPRIMISEVDAPNAFAHVSPFSFNKKELRELMGKKWKADRCEKYSWVNVAKRIVKVCEGCQK